MEEKYILEATVTNSGYSGIQVIWDASIKVAKGEVVLLLGSNGSGKTTFLKSIMGIIPPVKASVVLDGIDITRLPLNKRNSHGICYISEDTYFQNLTIYENLKMGNSSLKGEALKKKITEVFNVFPELKDRLHSKCSSLSGGQRKMLIMARAIMSDAKILIIDEPSGGLSPLFIEKVMDALALLKQNGLSILISEQNVEFSHLADHIYVLDNGRIVFYGTEKEAEENDAVNAAYFNI